MKGTTGVHDNSPAIEHNDIPVTDTTAPDSYNWK